MNQHGKDCCALSDFAAIAPVFIAPKSISMQYCAALLHPNEISSPGTASRLEKSAAYCARNKKKEKAFAGTAVVANARIPTSYRTDFNAFVPHGLKLLSA